MQHGETYIEELELRAPKSAKQSGIALSQTSIKSHPDMDPMARILETQARGYEAKLRIAKQMQSKQKREGA
ncbi:hypothetical protein IT409_02045 [Candidatus Falkowbacteria bacterium]|nr:hypothetical protein [Candidatus Falkowbacteria bacterium]